LRKRRRGITLVELIVASFVLGLLGLLTVALFRTGASGWKKLEAQSTMLADYEVLNTKISREAQRSVYGSASTDVGANGPTLAFLSALDDDGVFVLSDTYEPVWQKYLVFYHDQAKRSVYFAEVPLIKDSPEIKVPGPLQNYDGGSPDLDKYRTDGRLLMTDVDRCTFTLAGTMLTVEIEGSRKRYGDSKPETLEMINSTAFRN
jgi:Prokaryotic N-terminal methylation motif